MMTWYIPAKTFLLGEYVAINEGPALLLTTTPCFQLTLKDDPQLKGIHPESPAGLYWQHLNLKHGLDFYDPYQNKGGLGASSAQFVGAYLASHFLCDEPPCKTDMLERYYQFAWQGIGKRPSGYDVFAQSSQGSVYINAQRRQYKIYSWSFPDIGFVLLHTGKKLATHQHLQDISFAKGALNQLELLVETGQRAFETCNSTRLISAVNQYHEQLLSLDLVAEHTRHHIDQFIKDPNVLAAKGCGALGSDVLLLIVQQDKLRTFSNQLTLKGWDILATNHDLYLQSQFSENNMLKGLEISA